MEPNGECHILELSDSMHLKVHVPLHGGLRSCWLNLLYSRCFQEGNPYLGGRSDGQMEVFCLYVHGEH